MISMNKQITNVGDPSLDGPVFHLFEDWHHVLDVFGGERDCFLIAYSLSFSLSLYFG